MKHLPTILVLALAASLSLSALGGELYILAGERPRRFLTSSANGVSFSGAGAMADIFNLSNRDFYVEFVMRLDKSDPSNPLSIADFGPMWLRYLRGPWQLAYSHSAGTVYVFSQTVPQADLRWPASEVHHVFLKCVNYVASLYVDGDFIASENYSSQLTNYPWATAKDVTSTTIAFAPSHDIRLYRVGSIASEKHGTGGEDPETVLANHYNGGNPLKYRVKDPNRHLYLQVDENMIRMDKSRNRLNGKTMTPAKKLVGTMSWRTDDVYKKNLTGEGEPTSIPRYAGQYYTDTSATRTYYATGNRSLADWRLLAIAQDIADYPLLKANGVALLGTGDVTLTAEGYRNVEDALRHGATGDGVTDDRAALQAAVDSAAASGKALYFPEGTYRITGALTVPAGVKLTGAAGAAIEATGNALSVTGDRVEIENLSIAAGGTGIAVANASNVRIRRVVVSDAGDAVSVSNAEDVWIEDSLFSDATGAGVRLANANRALVRHCWFDGGATGVAVGAGNARTVVEGNFFVGTATGIAGGTGSTDTILAKNGFELCTAAGVALTGGTRTVIRANRFSNFGAEVYSVDAASLVTAAVTGNTAGKVRFTNADGLALTGNILSATPEIETSTSAVQSGNVVKE